MPDAKKKAVKPAVTGSVVEPTMWQRLLQYSKPVKRRSPGGVDEYILDDFDYDFVRGGSDPSASRAFTALDPYDVPFSVYRRQYAGYPHVTTHERIHQGQNLLRQPDEIGAMFGDRAQKVWPALQDIANRVPEFMPDFEIPAYLFDTGWKKDPPVGPIDPRANFGAYIRRSAGSNDANRQDDANRWLTMMNRRNRNFAEPAEMGMPPDLLREYVKHGPERLFNTERSLPPVPRSLFADLPPEEIATDDLYEIIKRTANEEARLRRQRLKR